ncbi:nitroreductase family protein (plasmid) [Comamonas endophytica]|uniref:Nitroreductase family protein n=2 Tax=Comamonas endophytica TaxID=2949090 RepID=A0ABY6GGE1_9BURK|nr:nitroreductase family protein [Acidovorax sp. 5MLIR]
MTEHQALLEQRYGAQTKPARMAWNAQIAALLLHRSVRNYLPEALPEGALEAMVAAAQSASTSSNLHQWSVVAVGDPALKARVAELASGRKKDANRFINDAPLVLLWVADLSRSHAITCDGGGDAQVHDYLDAFLMASIDAALAAQNAVVAAESMGLGVVYIGAMRNEAQALAELIHLPRYSFVAFGLVVGKPADLPGKPETVRPRPPQSVVLHHDRYDFQRSMAGLDDYEAEFGKFREHMGSARRSWKESVVHYNRFDYMDGREKLRQAMVERGFNLL